MQNPAESYTHNLPTARAEERRAIDALATEVGAAIHAGSPLPPAVAVAYRTFAVAHAHVRHLEASRNP